MALVPPGASLEERAQIYSKFLNDKEVVEFLPLGSGEEAWLTEQIPFYLYGIQNWRYEETLRALYVVFLDRFPHHRHRDEAQAHCRNQHITLISRRLHEKCMVTGFQKAGIYDLMQMVNPRYPGDIPVDIQLHSVQLAGPNPWNAAQRSHCLMLNSLNCAPPFTDGFDVDEARAVFASFRGHSSPPSTPNGAARDSDSGTMTLYVDVSYDIGCALNRNLL
ncbi:hypothetical protein C8J56DRAFT_1090687 [Mycena floridula]|nr:hypothetical protein C8J56DRAFT_1090687 [Mycena floridula]